MSGGLVGWLSRVLYGTEPQEPESQRPLGMVDEVVLGGGNPDTGIRVGPDTAMTISTVYACVGLLAETIAGLPMIVYQYTDDEGARRRAREHPLYPVLHDQPNEHQTSFEFAETMMAHVLLRGVAYAKIVSGRRGWVEQLIPLHPDRVEKQLLSSGRYIYRATDEQGRAEVLPQEKVFEIGGISLDGGKTRMSVISHAATSMGLTMSAERYGARFFKNDSRPSGILTTDGRLSPGVAQETKSEWLALHSGRHQHSVAVLQQGLSWQSIGVTPEEAQFLATREFQSEDVCRWFRVPPHMVGLTSKSTSWGSGIEQMGIGFVTYTLRPWLMRWSQAIKRDLMVGDDSYFVDFVIEALLRGDVKSRYEAYRTGHDGGWLSVNEIRRRENLNPIEGGDEYLRPLNMTPVGAESNHYSLLLNSSAERVVRKEIAALQRAWERCCDDRAAWGTAVIDFYHSHAGFVSQVMQISEDVAMAYCGEGQQILLTTDDVGGVLQAWCTERVGALAKLVIGGNRE